ncbi:RNA polymerase sigma factor sigF, chloroplastic [Linum perenne]
MECTASPGLENEEVQIVRSTRRLQRHSKRRRVLKEKLTLDNTPISWKPDPKYKALRRLTPEMESELMHHIKEMLKLEKVKDMFQSRFDREPTMVEWAEAMRFSPYTLKLKLDYGRMCREKFYKANLRLAYHMAEQFQGCGVPLVDLKQTYAAMQETSDDDDDDDDAEEELADEKYMSPEEYLVSQMTKRQIGEMLNVLGPRERRIIELRFGLEDGVGKSVQDIGDIYGLTRERVRQIESQALKELRECPASKGLSSVMFTKLPEKTETTFDIEEDDGTVA